MSNDNVVPFRGGNDCTPPQQPPAEPMGPRLAAFFLRGVCERLDRLQSTLDLLHENLKAKEDARSLSSLADLCSAEVGNIYGDVLLPVVKGLEANCEPDGAPAPGGGAA